MNVQQHDGDSIDEQINEEIEECSESESEQEEYPESVLEQEYDQCLTTEEIDGKIFRCNGTKNWQTQICHDCRKGNPVWDLENPILSLPIKKRDYLRVVFSEDEKKFLIS